MVLSHPEERWKGECFSTGAKVLVGTPAGARGASQWNEDKYGRTNITESIFKRWYFKEKDSGKEKMHMYFLRRHLLMSAFPVFALYRSLQGMKRVLERQV